VWDAYRMPWVPELFSAPALARLEEQRSRDKLVSVPFFDGLMTGELDALVGSFAGQPELHHPVRGRITGERAFAAFVTELNAWLGKRNVSVEDIDTLGDAGLTRSFSTWTVNPVASSFRWRPSPTSDPTDASWSCGCTTAAGR